MSAASELLDLLDHARRTSPFYADRIPHDLGSPADAERLLGSLPLLSRRDIQRHGPRLWSSEGAGGGDWRVVRTTGTTDEPVEVIVDDRGRRAEAAALAAHIDRCLGTPEWRERDIIHLTLHPGASSTALPSPWRVGARIVKWNLVWAWQRSDASFVDSVSHIGGNIVTAMPSVIELLCSRLAATGRTVAPLLVVLSGQTVDAHIREAARKALGCWPTSLYTLAEAGIVASECETTGGYHIEEIAAVVEIVDETRRVRPGIEGELVVTPLQNRAMPLVRYRTGDRATWSDRPCGCGRTAGLFFLSSGRRPSRLVTESGATVNVVRFAKVLAGLSVSRIHVDQGEAGGARVSYEAERELGSADRSLLVGALRAALGPEAEVIIRRSETTTDALGTASAPTEGSGPAEPVGPALEDVARWLRTELSDRPDLEAAVITGSFLDPEVAGAWSDIDLVLLVRGEVVVAAWAPLAQRLRRTLSKLRINVVDVDRVSERSPLLACRLLREHHGVVGQPTQTLVPWPSQASLRQAAAFWSDDAAAALWTRLSDPETACREPIGEARFASRYALDGLRYLYLTTGCRETAARTILELAADDPPGYWLEDLAEAFNVAREQRPPPAAGSGRSERYLEAAFACACEVAARV